MSDFSCDYPKILLLIKKRREGRILNIFRSILWRLRACTTGTSSSRSAALTTPSHRRGRTTEKLVEDGVRGRAEGWLFCCVFLPCNDMSTYFLTLWTPHLILKSKCGAKYFVWRQNIYILRLLLLDANIPIALYLAS